MPDLPRAIEEFERTDEGDGHVRCPGCGEADKGVAIVGNGLKCQHARCAGKGVRAGSRI